jgi:hypothetical protein
MISGGVQREIAARHFNMAAGELDDVAFDHPT